MFIIMLCLRQLLVYITYTKYDLSFLYVQESLLLLQQNVHRHSIIKRQAALNFYFHKLCHSVSIVTHYLGIGQECIKGIVNSRDPGQAYSFVSDLAVVGIEAAAPPRPAAGSGAWGARD